MEKYIKILQDLDAYREPSLYSGVAETFKKGQFVQYKRSKIREKMEWLEVYNSFSEIIYIPRDTGKYYTCQYIEIEDELLIGFCMQQKNTERNVIDQVRVMPLNAEKNDEKNEIFEVKRLLDDKRGTTQSLRLEYNPRQIELKSQTLRKGDCYHIISPKGSLFVELSDLYDSPIYVMSNLQHGNPKNSWMIFSFYTLSVLGIIFILIQIFGNEWDGPMVIPVILIFLPAALVAGIFVLLLKVAFLILEGIYSVIYKRL